MGREVDLMRRPTTCDNCGRGSEDNYVVYNTKVTDEQWNQLEICAYYKTTVRGIKSIDKKAANIPISKIYYDSSDRKYDVCLCEVCVSYMGNWR